MELLGSDCDPAFVYLDSEAVMAAGMLDRLRCLGLELNDIVQGYVQQRAVATSHLAALKASLLMRASGPDSGAAVGKSGAVTL